MKDKAADQRKQQKTEQCEWSVCLGIDNVSFDPLFGNKGNNMDQLIGNHFNELVCPDRPGEDGSLYGVKNEKA